MVNLERSFAYFDIFISISFWVTLLISGVYFISGLSASFSIKKSKFSPFFPLVTTLFGFIVGLFYGVISSILLTAVCVSANLTLKWYQSFLCSVVLTLFHILLSFFQEVLQI
ncbi:hypothetical protein RB653_005219 [Dictyostelium firmibasis]|uniref:Uncharacterized protein n=1 Tax=Dictyostelium firmibasis TaxID=79012 RepID=A0AAN7YXZ1_9MYCE